MPGTSLLCLHLRKIGHSSLHSSMPAFTVSAGLSCRDRASDIVTRSKSRAGHATANSRISDDLRHASWTRSASRILECRKPQRRGAVRWRGHSFCMGWLSDLVRGALPGRCALLVRQLQRIVVRRVIENGERCGRLHVGWHLPQHLHRIVHELNAFAHVDQCSIAHVRARDRRRMAETRTRLGAEHESPAPRQRRAPASPKLGKVDRANRTTSTHNEQ